MMTNMLSIQGLSKTYATGVEALKPLDLTIAKGEIFALLGPNGAGKTTMISIVGVVTPSAGQCRSRQRYLAATIARRGAESGWSRKTQHRRIRDVWERSISAGACRLRAPTRPFRKC